MQTVVVMTKQAALGPIDPSVNNPLNPQASIGGQLKQVPVSVESVRGYLDAAREELKIEGEQSLTSVLLNLTTHIHPLVAWRNIPNKSTDSVFG